MEFLIRQASGQPFESEGVRHTTILRNMGTGAPEPKEWVGREFATLEDLLTWKRELGTEIVITTTPEFLFRCEVLEGPELPEWTIEIYDDYRE